MGFIEFWTECFRRAFRGRLLLAGGISGLLALVAVPVGIELREWFGEFGASSWVPFYIFGTVFVLLVLLGLVRAPRDMYSEARAEIDQLKLTIEDRDAIQRALNELWRLRREGVELRNKPIVASELADWEYDMGVWHQEVLAQAVTVSENFRQWLEVLDQMQTNPVANPINDPHRHQLCFYSTVLRRLQIFLEKDLKWPQVGIAPRQRVG